MEAEPTPFTLPCLPSINPTPFASEQIKRSPVVTLDKTGEGDTEDTGASGNVTHHAARVATSRDAFMPLHQNPTTQALPQQTDELNRATLVITFLSSMLLPEPNQLRVDHITDHLAFAVDMATQRAGIPLLAPEHS